MDALLLSSTIEAVTVYRTGARVRRVAPLDFDGARPVRVRLNGLPLSLDDASCRLSIEGGAGLTASDLRVGLDVVEGASPAEPPAEAALREAKAAEAKRRARVDRLRRARERLAAMPIEPRLRVEQSMPVPPPTDARLALAAFRREETERLDAELAAAEIELARAERERKGLEDRARRASTERSARPHELRKSAVIGLAGEARGPFRLVLEYLVPGARWVPAYTLRLDRSMREAELSMRAMVVQRTGEDWRDVRLTLATAAPQRWTALPELRSMRIGRRQPPRPKRGWRAPPLGADALYADYDHAFRARGAPVAAAQAEAIAAMVADALEGPAPEAQPLPVTASAPAAPSPSAPPQPAMPPMPKSARSMPFAMPERSVAPAPSERVEMTRGRAASYGGAPPAPAPMAAPAPPVPTAPAELAAPESLLDYGRLRMPSADEGGRGKLAPAAQASIYVELLVATHAQVKLDLGAVLRDATRDAERAERAELPPGHFPIADDAGFAYAFDADAPVELASKGEWRSIAVVTRSGEAAPRFVVVPRESTDAFRTVALDNPLGAPILRGPVDVYVDGAFLATSAFDATPAGGRVELGLGVDSAIKVARNTHFAEETRGLLRGSIELAHRVRVELANRRPDPATIEVRERLPVAAPSEEELTVEVRRVDPPWEAFEQVDPPLEGGHRWVVEVPAREERTLALDYCVRIASKRELVGGNRREGT